MFVPVGRGRVTTGGAAGLGHRIPSAPGPGPAAQQTPAREPGAPWRAVDAHRLDGVAAARRLESAARWGQGRDALLVEVQHPQQDPGDEPGTLLAHRVSSRALSVADVSPVRRSRRRSACDAVTAALLARITTSRSSAG